MRAYAHILWACLVRCVMYPLPLIIGCVRPATNAFKAVQHNSMPSGKSAPHTHTHFLRCANICIKTRRATTTTTTTASATIEPGDKVNQRTRTFNRGRSQRRPCVTQCERDLAFRWTNYTRATQMRCAPWVCALGADRDPALGSQPFFQPAKYASCGRMRPSRPCLHWHSSTERAR